jgi:hypothetical protein
MGVGAEDNFRDRTSLLRDRESLIAQVPTKEPNMRVFHRN